MMFFDNSYFTVAIYLAVVMGVIIGILHWYEAVATDSRMQRMMVSCGMDENTAANAGRVLKLDMLAARSRCRNCPITRLCDRWLDGEIPANNGFCPNAEAFRRAAGFEDRQGAPSN